MKRSSVAGVLSGAPRVFQSGISSSRARGSNTAPDRIWAPTSEPFSMTQTASSRAAAAASCFSRIAAASPDGPAPTITTSYSIVSRCILPFPRWVPGAPPCTCNRRPFYTDWAGRQIAGARESLAPHGRAALNRSIMSDARLWAELLRWYVEMGVDEAIAEIPNDRTRPGPVREPVRAQAGRAGTPPAAAPRPLPDAIVAPGAAALAKAATTLAELARAVAEFEG